MKKVIAGLVALLAFTPVVASAYTDCRDTTDGCTVQQLVQISKQTFLSKESRVSALQQAISKLVALIAQYKEPKQDSGHDTACWVPTYDLYIGRTDTETNGEVSRLQVWLKGQGVFPDAQGTGYYGEKTAAAVMKWQKAHGMDFVTLKSGVGKQTRAKMLEACGTSAPIQCAKNDDSPVVTSIEPVSGPTGTVATIRGCNLSGFEGDLIATFEKDGTAILLGDTQHNPKDFSKIVVTVKEPCSVGQAYIPPGDESGIPKTCPYAPMTSGIYSVSVSPWGKKSNVVNFTLTQ